jgi:N-acetyl-gamma-glutamyl-phosphate reductase
VNRGIYTTIHAGLRAGVTADRIDAIMVSAYRTEHFVRLLGGSVLPDIKNVTTTNFLDVAWRIDWRTSRIVLLSCEDNLVKGAAGQAIQCLNLMCGWDEHAGL